MATTIQYLTFEEFMESTHKRAYAFAVRLTGNKDDAEDLTQETYVRAYRAFERRDRSRSPQAWVMQIMFNAFVDLLRFRSRRPNTCSLDALQEDNAFFDAVDEGQNPEENLLHNSLSEPMRRALDRLSEDQQKLIRMAVIEQESYDTLAQKLGCQLATLKTRLHRAHRELRRHLVQLDPTYARLSGVTQA